MKKREKFVDDGRTIANMNVEGMPWYNPTRNNPSSGEQKEEMTKAQTLAMIRGVVGAALLVGLVFVVVFGLVIFLMLKMWT